MSNSYKTCILISIFVTLFPLSTESAMVTIYGIGGTNLHRKVVSVKEAKYKNMVRQSVDFSCGAAALATLLKFYYGKNEITEQEIVKYLLKHGDIKKIQWGGFSFLDLKKYVTNELRFLANGYKLNDYNLLEKLKIPVIILISAKGYKHFVVLKGMQNEKAYIADPLRGNIALNKSEFYDAWDGNIFVVLNTDKREGESRLDLESAIVDAPKSQVLRLSDSAVSYYNNMGIKNIIVFPAEF